MSTGKRAVLTSVGPGTGLAIVRPHMAGGYRVAMIARELPDTHAFAGDVTD
ncbi:hypothetical protein [Pseudomonas sp. BIC9C]|uniref:hypothetical protein n=1 Tax=Pseudomonas sp. BIC9C TaxID=3078458 RepID=UPI002AD1EF09|nr:hypothetical protein [Pseudomonas sp. BIC9C]